MAQVALTTIDNPYDVFDEFDQWNSYDQRKGYNTLALIARVNKTSDETSEEQQMQDWENAIDDILKYANFGLYKKVVR